MNDVKNIHERAMEAAVEAAWNNIETGNGGPFGAAVAKNGEILVACGNSVLSSHDPTAHAEVNAIRLAAEKLGTHNLSGCSIYATGYPCPMCLAAIAWANITDVYYANTLEEAAAIDFRDEDIYAFIRGEDDGLLHLEHLEIEDAQGLYSEYARRHCEMY